MRPEECQAEAGVAPGPRLNKFREIGQNDNLNRPPRDGRSVVITNNPKYSMSVFTVFGYVEGHLRQPCHWTAEGRYRMDGPPDPRDLVYHGDLTANITDHERAEMIYAQPSLLYRHLLAS